MNSASPRDIVGLRIEDVEQLGSYWMKNHQEQSL